MQQNSETCVDVDVCTEHVALRHACFLLHALWCGCTGRVCVIDIQDQWQLGLQGLFHVARPHAGMQSVLADCDSATGTQKAGSNLLQRSPIVLYITAGSSCLAY